MLAISHGNADAERGFSDSGHYLTEDRSAISERTLSAIMTIKDTLKKDYGNKPELVLIPDRLITLARTAHRSYQEHLDIERKLKLKEEEEKQKALEERMREKEKKMEMEKKN